MRHIVRTMILVVALMMSATGTAWALDATDIIINKIPADTKDENNQTVVVAGTAEVKSVNSDTRFVTLTVTPKSGSGYTINEKMITVEPMIDPSLAPSHRASILAGTITVTHTSGNDYTFTLPAQYSKANVTVRFFKPNSDTNVTQIFSLSELGASGNYELVCDVDASSYTTIATFTGTLTGQPKDDGTFPVIMNLSCPLFTTATGATISNIMLDKVSISQAGQTGSFACVANGTTRIYNCGILSGSVKSTGTSTSDNDTDCCGGLVGFLDGTARVINCFSYANITGGNRVGGIVGYNNKSTTSKTSEQRTMVMNCMFYGDITGGENKAPIYNGITISNLSDNGVGNYNYFLAEASYVQNQDFQTPNCALMAETRFLQRFEFFRHLLNGHRKLAAWWVTGTYSDTEKELMAKWVLEPSQIGTSTPYPILKKSGKYPSVVNYDAKNAVAGKPRNQGGRLGTLSVHIQASTNDAVFGAPTGASITTSDTTLVITDKDTLHYNFNYYKVQLPYYNEVGTKNYTGYRVVTGWKIVKINDSTEGTGSYSEGDDVSYDKDGNMITPYNFADRKCTNKDLYSESGRVFNQGAYWDVPEGVTKITIEPYWAKAAYVADAYADVVYNSGMGTAKNVPTIGGGEIYKNNNDYDITGDGVKQKVYTSISNAKGSADTQINPQANHSVNDYAIVLIGNYHQTTAKNADIGSKSQPYTVTTIDLDSDNEPDYSFMFRNDGRNKVHPVKYDFLNLVGLGMAQKSAGSNGSYNLGIMEPLGWFEMTNTSLFRVTQFEYDYNKNGISRAAAPLILQGGVMEQWVSGQDNGASNNTTYFHVGGNVWFKEFHRGCHQDSKLQTKHPPVSVTGGDFDEFYLTGLYTTEVTSFPDNAECYINGGRFGTVAGAGMEGIGKDIGADNTGNITWQIQNADIKEFYAGGINGANNKTVEGNLSTTITGGKIDLFCGGPKFGDMNEGKTVITNATGCVFGTYFGAGYGGNSYSREAPKNYSTSITNIEWNKWVRGEIKAPNTASDFSGYKREYKSKYGGVSARFSYQFIPLSDNTTNVARLFIDYVCFSLATTHNVTSNLNECTITGNFYGGGSLGKVDGNVTSTLKDCKFNNNVYGAGFSAEIPTVEADSLGGFRIEPYYYTSLGTYRTGVKGKTTTYTWKPKTGSVYVDNDLHELYTTEDLNALGTVTGNVTLNILGDNTVIMGDVYGGGAEAKSNTDYYKASSPNTNTKTTVNLLGGKILGDAYGCGLGRLAKAAVGTEGTPGYKPAVTAVPADAGNVKVNLNGLETEDYVASIHSSLVDAVKTDTDHPDKIDYYKLKSDNKGCIVNRVFGCNNLNGTPKGTAKVHVFKTNGTSKTASDHLDDIDDKNHSYHVEAVYGGGNLAPYEPTKAFSSEATTKAEAYTQVIIEGCDQTSIRQVYGGGNAASTPATQVDVHGTYEIEEVFGGGNGKDDISKDGGTTYIKNPGANVGFKDYWDYENEQDMANYDTKEKRQDAGFIANYVYGSGEAHVNIHGGRIHRVYGGSNTKGNVKAVAVTMLEDVSGCDFKVDEAYGGGKSAPMDGESQLHMSCIPGLKNAYGGAEEADIQSDVTLTITNGNFDRVFGGNNVSGTIHGTITVNVEETGCHKITIGQLYGGGNQAAYTGPEIKDNNGNGTGVFQGPTVNVKSFTSIGDVYGGGYGKTATVTGDTYVNINVCEGKTFGDEETAEENRAAIATNWKYKDDNGEIKDVTNNPGYKEITFSEYVRTANGGFDYNDDGSRKVEDKSITVYFPPHTSGAIGGINTVYGGGNAAMVVGSTHVNVGTATTVTQTENQATVTKTVKGANIIGNVYGGGNAAEVTGDTNVQIGRAATE